MSSGGQCYLCTDNQKPRTGSSALLQQLETRDLVAIKRNYFAVEQQGVCRQVGDGCGDLCIRLRPILVIAGQQRDLRAFFVSKDAVAVILLFVDPAGRLKGVLTRVASIGHTRNGIRLRDIGSLVLDAAKRQVDAGLHDAGLLWHFVDFPHDCTIKRTLENDHRRGGGQKPTFSLQGVEAVRFRQSDLRDYFGCKLDPCP